ncbi:MAG TPA: efflux RND transporter periplasmic adaptor subunit [Roseateles sp.]
MMKMTWLAALLLATAAHAETAYDGLIEPSQMLEIRSPVSGLIAQVNAQRGGLVKKGAVIVSLDTSVERSATELARYRASVDGAIRSGESRLQHADSKLKRRSELAEKRYGTAQELEDAQAEQRIAQADVQLARENRQIAKLEADHAQTLAAQKQLRSPIDGVVVEQALFPGEMAEAGEGRKPILKIAQINPLRVSVLLPAALYPRIKAGMKAEVRPEKPLDGDRYTSTVAMVDRVIDAASGTFRVHLMLPNADSALPGGLRCKVVFAGV